MIVLFLFQIIYAIIFALTFYFPDSIVLPFGIDPIVVTAVSYFKGAFDTLPYLETLFSAFIFALLFELGLLIMKVVLGSRTPTTN